MCKKVASAIQVPGGAAVVTSGPGVPSDDERFPFDSGEFFNADENGEFLGDADDVGGEDDEWHTDNDTDYDVGAYAGGKKKSYRKLYKRSNKKTRKTTKRKTCKKIKRNFKTSFRSTVKR
jgi:hypothetical protein